MRFLHVAVFGVVLGLAFAHHSADVQSKNQDRINAIHKSIFTPEYNVNVRPTNYNRENGTTLITVQFKDVRVLQVDETTGQLTFQALYRRRWVDPRLSFNDSVISYFPLRDYKTAMWCPDLYFVNGVDSQVGHSHHSKTRYTGISSNGAVFSSTRLTQTLFCPQLYNKEATEIVCSTGLKSYGYYSDELEVAFNSEEAIVNNQRDTLSLQRFNFEGVTTSKCLDTKDVDHQYPCLSLAFKLTRK